MHYKSINTFYIIVILYLEYMYKIRIGIYLITVKLDKSWKTKNITGFTHFLMEGVSICIHRNLSDRHPIYKILLPHFQFMHAGNK